MKSQLPRIVLVVAVLAAWPAHAQEGLPILAGVPLVPVYEIVSSPAVQAPTPIAVPRPRPAAASGREMAIYAAYGMFQALDVHSTMRALDNNGVEANPFLRSIVSSPGRLITLKAASTAGIIYFAERLRRKNPAAALALSIGVTSLQAYVVAHNYRVARKR